MRIASHSLEALPSDSDVQHVLRAWKLLLKADGHLSPDVQAAMTGLVAWSFLRSEGLDPEAFMRELTEATRTGKAH